MGKKKKNSKKNKKMLKEKAVIAVPRITILGKVKNLLFRQGKKDETDKKKDEMQKKLIPENKKKGKKKDKDKKNKDIRQEKQVGNLYNTQATNVRQGFFTKEQLQIIKNLKSKKIEKKETGNEKQESVKENLFNVTEIFHSIQGESTFAGLPTVFIRFQGCNLRCTWCDTGYALKVKKERNRLSAEQILKKINKYDCKNICITGGEPLMHKNVPELMTLLCNSGYNVSLETNGYYSLKEIDKRVSKIVDFKCPGSKMQSKNEFSNIEYLTKNDEVKFVVKDKEDYKWAKDITRKFNLTEKVNTVLFSPVFGKLDTKELSKWILNDDNKGRLQIQLHKYIWNPKKRGV